MNFSDSSASYINCTLEKGTETSHTDMLMQVSKSIMLNEKGKVDEIRFIDHDLATGIYPDMKKYGWKIDV
ncbi:hypothetical protein ACVWYG_001451 [Pedobacter sp. UYEF25]